MNKTFHTIAVLFIVAWMVKPDSVEATTQTDSALFKAVSIADLRLERIGFSLASAGISLCAKRDAGTGIVIRSLSEFAPHFRRAAKAALSFGTPVVVEAVIPDSPAAAAGLLPGDGLLQVADRAFPQDFPEDEAPPALADLDAAHSLLESLPTDRPVTVRILRGTTVLALHLKPVPVCKSRFALALNDRAASDADGTTVRIGAKLLERLSEAGLAVVVAHELSHNILNHAAILDRLNVKQGIAGEFGRSARETLRLEDEADRFSVGLLARAGYSPYSVSTFWRGEGRALTGSLPRGPSHRGWRSRANFAEEEATRLGSAP